MKRRRSSPLWTAAGLFVLAAFLMRACLGQAGASPVPPGQGTPNGAAGQAAPEGTVVLGPAEWAVWANIPGPARSGPEDCVYAAPTQGGSAPETVQIGWGPLPASGAGGRFPALPAEWLRQWWGQRPDEREALRGALEVGLRQLRSDGSQPVCRAVEIEPAVCKPAKTAAALAAGFQLTANGAYVLFPVTGVDWDDPQVVFMLWGSYSPECGASTATPSPTSTLVPTPTPTVVSPTPTATQVPPTATPTWTPSPTATPGVRRVFLPLILRWEDPCPTGFVRASNVRGTWYLPLNSAEVQSIGHLPWTSPTMFQVVGDIGPVQWVKYSPSPYQNLVGDSFTYPGGNPGAEFSLYWFSMCGQAHMLDNVDP